MTNREGRSPIAFTCDHASTILPAEFGTLGLPIAEVAYDVALDLGAMPSARRMAAAPGLLPPVGETSSLTGDRVYFTQERHVPSERKSATMKSLAKPVSKKGRTLLTNMFTDLGLEEDSESPTSDYRPPYHLTEREKTCQMKPRNMKEGSPITYRVRNTSKNAS
ncbi:hypothetical protein [Phyllobacterium sp.]|uniref:hypothetical protein n=1 Tax=Phyllobacterium sp. TaxID=1871046 RepID=UPI0030F42B3F